jgi:tRNA threonylcarbamoyladenosine biosynthesis protein TsaB
MRVLALDAATEACSVALLDGERLFARHEEFGKSHADRLLAMVEEVLAEAALGLNALDGIAASIGPGAFTGVRITVAVAQGLGFGAGLKIVPVSTLETLAMQLLQAQPGTARVLACLDARMGEVYWGCYAADALRGVRVTAAARVSAPGEVSLAAGLSHRGIGRGFSAYPALADLPGLQVAAGDRLALPAAPALAQLGALRLRAGEARDAEDFAPLYLRDRVALTEAERAQK